MLIRSFAPMTRLEAVFDAVFPAALPANAKLALRPPVVLRKSRRPIESDMAYPSCSGIEIRQEVYSIECRFVNRRRWKRAFPESALHPSRSGSVHAARGCCPATPGAY